MRNKGMAIIGLVIMIAGVLLLLANFLNFSLFAVCFPLGLILLGVFVLLRPRMVAPGTKNSFVLIGDFDRSGQWTLTDEEFWTLIADAEFDLTKAEIPAGETTIRGFGFVNDVEIFIPADVGLALDVSSFVTSLKLAGENEETAILSPVNWRSDGYKGMERRVRFELTQFVGDIKVRQF